ncbi:MAG TPA: zinc-ribbon domain containing protein [Dehalococcoidia bacterium]|nr:zinc-ribbon domain containing protein [Dehalococcoidia bacterium]
MQFMDVEIRCKLCGETFSWSADEQRFYYDNDLSQPKKCPACRADFRRKLHRQQEERQAREVQQWH